MSSISSSGASVDGLASGLNTTELIASLMSLEARPQTLLKSKKTGFETQITSFEAVRSDLSALKLSAQGLIGANDWTPVKATSSDTSLAAVKAGTGDSTGSVTFTVDSLAANHTITSGGTAAAMTDVVTSGPDITLGVGASSRSIPVGGGTLQEVVDAVNNQADLGITATAVKVGDNAYRLQLAAKAPGAANTITGGAEITGMGSSWLTTSAAADARITVGSGGNAYSISSASNSLDGVLPGVTIELIKQGGPVTVSSYPDSAALSGKLAALVAAVNAALAEIRTQSKYDPSTKKGSPLTGDGTVRDIQRGLVEAISNPVNGQYPDTYGLSVARDGTINFDAAKFEAAYTKDPDATQRFFDAAATPTDAGGLATKLSAAVDKATGTDGSLATVLKGRQQLVLDLQTQIEAYQIRLDKREVGLKKQFSALETTLGSLKNQSSWLSGQLSSISS